MKSGRRSFFGVLAATLAALFVGRTAKAELIYGVVPEPDPAFFGDHPPWNGGGVRTTITIDSTWADGKEAKEQRAVYWATNWTDEAGDSWYAQGLPGEIASKFNRSEQYRQAVATTVPSTSAAV